MAFLFVFFGGRGPFVNEVHYLAKAKHFWDPQWCRGDPFLESTDAHVGFFAAIGWLTRLVPLDTAALLWRLASWGFIASAWRRLCWSMGIRDLDAFLAFGLTVYLVTYQQLAGEWFVSGVEAKPFSYGFVLIALAYALQQRWYSAWLRSGLAIFFHPVVGGWTLLGLGTIGLATRPPRDPDQPPRALSDRSILPAVALATALAVVGIAPLLLLQWPVPREDRVEAEQIHVYQRLPHHLVIHRMATQNQIRFAVLVAIWCAMAWQDRRHRAVWPLHLFVAYALLLTFIGLLIDLATLHRPDEGAHWLKYYWFRMSDVFVPVGIALGAFAAAGQRSHRALDGLRVVILILLAFVGVSRFQADWRDPRPPADRQGHFGLAGSTEVHLARHRDWKELCRWVREYTAPDALFLTPTHSQTFKWYSERPELVTWKDCPQDPESILRWRKLLDEVQTLGFYRGEERPSAESWEQFARANKVDYLITLRELDPTTFPLPHVYRNDTFDIYRVPK